MTAQDDQAKDYLKWPLEEIQQEYWKMRLKNAQLELRESMAIQAQQEVEDLAAAFNKFLRRDDD